MRRPAAILLVLSVAVLALALIPAAGLAAKGGNSGNTTHGNGGGNGGGGSGGGGGSTTGSSSISLATPLVYDANGNGLPNVGDVVMFDVSTTATDQPFVNLQCFQNGVLVANGWKGYFEGSLDTTWGFGLGSGAWQGGAAECTAWVNMYTKQGWKQLASTSFHVDA